MSFEEFVKKAGKKDLTHIRISKGIFGYCDEERVIYGVNNAKYIKLRASKKTYYLVHWPENKISDEELENVYDDLIYRMLDEGFFVFEWLPESFYSN